jgi:hypothetical protein
MFLFFASESDQKFFFARPYNDRRFTRGGAPPPSPA